MQKRYRDLLRNIITNLRLTLSGSTNCANGGADGQRGDLDRELERLGIAPDGAITPFDALPNPTPVERRARRVAEAQLDSGARTTERGSDETAIRNRKSEIRNEIVERAAYTWINRLLALRAMEARGLINEILRSDPAYDGLSEALFVLRQTQPQRAAGPDGGWWAVIEDACGAQAASLPGLFDLADPSAALRPSTPALLRCVALIGTTPAGYTAEEADASFADPDAIGWAYQFYQEEAKARTYAKLNSGGKAATRAEIASVTQLFTEPYMVKWLLQNSLGRTYHELYPDSRLLETWEYYIRTPAEEQGSLCGGAEGQSACRRLEDLTFMDPCMGSGHFEREAFDMYFAMYREQYPDMSAAEIADRILTHHLHGIDLDPRAAQLAALTLYLRAWELVRDERRAQRLTGLGAYRPPAMNLATTPTGLSSGSLERHLLRHPEDRIYRPLLEGIFAALEQADVLGSLLRPGEQLDAAIGAFRKQGSGQLGLLADDADLNRLLGELARHDPEELKRVLLERVARSFAAEAADADDVAMALFGREAGEGLRLLHLLDRQYALVATNPPFATAANLAPLSKAYLARYYEQGKHDLYSAFILRCCELCASLGRVALVTMQGWMFLSTYAGMRTVADRELSNPDLARKGVIRENTVEGIVQLGRYAFSEIGNAVVAPALFVFRRDHPPSGHRMWACRLVSPRPSEQQAKLVRRAVNSSAEGNSVFQSVQEDLLRIRGAPLVYWLPKGLLEIQAGENTLEKHAVIGEGLSTSNNDRFVRYHWETDRAITQRWQPLSKGGSYRKWHGLEWFEVDWQHSGARVKQHLTEKYPYLGGNVGFKVKDESLYLAKVLTYSTMARGSLGVRFTHLSLYDNSGSFIAPTSPSELNWLAAVLNSRVVSFLVRAISQSLSLKYMYLRDLSLPTETNRVHLERLAAYLYHLAYTRSQGLIDEESFLAAAANPDSRASAAVQLAAEAITERLVFQAYAVDEPSEHRITDETGVPAGWHPMIRDYDALPTLPAEVGLPPLLEVVPKYLQAQQSVRPHALELERIKCDLRTLYEAGPGAKPDLEESADEQNQEEGETTIGAAIPIPSETFLEELSQKLQIHPISVYWLLEELRAEGARCKPEELRLLEDRLSVLVLRLLGHRWPRQIEAGEPVPSWADPDGIIPLTTISGETGLAERVRSRMRAEEGDRGAQQVEALLRELTGQTLEEWLRRTFFARHVRQFKHRPIAWHLASSPTKDGGRRTKAKREPAFECLLYYHACRGDVLARLRAHYVEPLIRLETATAADARRRGDETAAVIAVSRVQELEEFAARLRDIEESGFACADLDRLLADESFDRWSGDGIVPPASADELVAQERAWRVDINDGVRVNIAPLQLAGLLTGDVLRPDDARKAIADRARWRSDERRWVREGVLPRCGWMDEDVPESPRWTARAPEREAEQRKLEEKRRAVMERLEKSGSTAS